MKEDKLFDFLYEEYLKDVQKRITESASNMFDKGEQGKYQEWHKKRVLQLCKTFKEKLK